MIHQQTYKWTPLPIHKAGIVVVLGVLVVWLFRYDPQVSNSTPACVFKFVTGWDCPGCGSARAVHQLLHGHIIQAADYNLMLVILLPYLTAKLYCWLTNKSTIWADKIYRAKWVFWFVVIFWAVRNMDVAAFSFLNSNL